MHQANRPCNKVKWSEEEEEPKKETYLDLFEPKGLTVWIAQDFRD